MSGVFVSKASVSRSSYRSKVTHAPSKAALSSDGLKEDGQSMSKGSARPSASYATKSCSVPPTRNATGCKEERARRSSDWTSCKAMILDPFQVRWLQSIFRVGPPVQRDADVGRVGRGDDLVLYFQFHIFTLDAFSLRWRCGVPRVRLVVMYKLVRVPMVELELRRQQCEAGY